MEAVGQIGDFKKGVHECRHETRIDDECSASNTMERTRFDATRERDMIRTQFANAQQEGTNYSLAVIVLVSEGHGDRTCIGNQLCVIMGQRLLERKECGRHEASMTFTMARKICWKACRSQRSCVTQQLQDLGMRQAAKRYDCVTRQQKHEPHRDVPG